MTRAEAREAWKRLKSLLHAGMITYDQYIARKRPLKRAFRGKE